MGGYAIHGEEWKCWVNLFVLVSDEWHSASFSLLLLGKLKMNFTYFMLADNIILICFLFSALIITDATYA